MTKVTDGQKQSTKKLKFSLLRSFFNFIKDSFDSNLSNPCDTPLLRKTFKTAKGKAWTILDRDVVDEIIFKTDNSRNRLLLELMARGGMRVGEVLNLKVQNIHGRKLVNMKLNPHDLRRHAATYASRSGVPIEIVSKIILRHANLSTTQRYLGKVSDTEAIHWIDNLYG